MGRYRGYKPKNELNRK